MRSSRSKLKPWVQTARPSTNDPRSEVRFIERRLLNDGTIELAHVPVRPDYVSAGRRAERTRPPASRLDRPSEAIRFAAPGLLGVCDSGRPGVQEGFCRCPARYASANAPEPVRANRWLEKVRSGSPDTGRRFPLMGPPPASSDTY